MSVEYHTAQFKNDSGGIAEKNSYTRRMASQGWRIASEVIEQGHFKGGQACCLSTMCCLPAGFLAGRTAAIVTVTFVREQATGRFCPACGTPAPGEAAFCGRCGKPVPTLVATGPPPIPQTRGSTTGVTQAGIGQGDSDTLVGGVALVGILVLIILVMAIAQHC